LKARANSVQKIGDKRLTTEKHGESRKEIAPIKLLQKKYKFSVLFRENPWWKIKKQALWDQEGRKER
jgi:hypothetical protein